jgi:Rps23 Pro-64 3,4-dihydroxylase Tpa1-like proline 4-hydroxylase
MEVTKLPFSVPSLCIDEFLSNAEADRILQECIDLRKVYLQARVFDGPAATKVNRDYRTNDVVMIDDIFRHDPHRSDILTILKQKIWAEECRSLWHDGYYIFDIINYSTWQEAVISRYGEGDFYKKHQDTRRDHITYRLVTIVYYVNRLPQRFTGGSLVLWHDDEYFRVEPKHNRAVIFPSFTFHEVEVVKMQSENWDEARFSLNYWIGFR